MMTIPEMIMYTIVSVLIFGALMGLAWRDGFEQGHSAANRMHVRWWGNTRGQLRRYGETLAGLDNRIDGIEARLAKAETLLKFVSNSLYGRENVEKMAKDAGITLYANNEPYDNIPDINPEDWNCDTCVNDGDMSHLQCRYCHEGSCYIKKEEPLKFDHEPSGEVVGKVTETEDTGSGMRFKISPYDEYTASKATVLDNAVKPNEEVVVKED